MRTIKVKGGQLATFDLRPGRIIRLSLPETPVCTGEGKVNPFGAMGGELLLFDPRSGRALQLKVERVELHPATTKVRLVQKAVPLAVKKSWSLVWVATLRVL